MGPDQLLLAEIAAVCWLLLLLYASLQPELNVCWLAVAVPVLRKGLVVGGCGCTCTSGSEDSGQAPAAELLCFNWLCLSC
jgi:hypothetical protein